MDKSVYAVANVTNMHGMFYMTGQNNNTDFSSAIDSWDTSNVTDMGDIFYLASEITPGL
jgi:surface protein